MRPSSRGTRTRPRSCCSATGFKAVFKSLAKDIRALPPERAAQFLRVMLPDTTVRVVEPADLPAAVTAGTLVLPDEDVTRQLAERATACARAGNWSSTRPSCAGTGSGAGRSGPWRPTARSRSPSLPEPLLAGPGSWRAAARTGGGRWARSRGATSEVLGAAWNHHCPTEYAPYTDGDPRDGFSRGVRADLSTAIHAEASVVARAARDGISLDGADLYVTTFPCPACARLIAESGFRRCYFSGAYSVLDGDAVLRAAGVELLWVDAATG